MGIKYLILRLYCLPLKNFGWQPVNTHSTHSVLCCSPVDYLLTYQPLSKVDAAGQRYTKNFCISGLGNQKAQLLGELTNFFNGRIKFN
jgi:hypothetical protein